MGHIPCDLRENLARGVRACCKNLLKGATIQYQYTVVHHCAAAGRVWFLTEHGAFPDKTTRSNPGCRVPDFTRAQEHFNLAGLNDKQLRLRLPGMVEEFSQSVSSHRGPLCDLQKVLVQQVPKELNLFQRTQKLTHCFLLYR